MDGSIHSRVWNCQPALRLSPGPLAALCGVTAVLAHELADFGLELPGVALPTALALGVAVALGARVSLGVGVAVGGRAVWLAVALGERPSVGKHYALPVFDPTTMGSKEVGLDVRAESLFVLNDSAVFDSSARHGGPQPLPLQGMIPGWTEGLQLMNTGSKYRFWMPPALGFGETGAPPKIPGNALVSFDVTLNAIMPPQALGMGGMPPGHGGM